MFDISKIVITPEMLKLVAEIDEFKGAWQLFGNLAPERLQMLKKIATIESIGSSTRIEGQDYQTVKLSNYYPNLIHAHFVL
ncbi:hypothetical protein [Wolbachia sp. wLmal]|uniref:hypothetical protein n=1 Tax=Wolbachia sp. wLmal TaxID=3342489 RepID=UPI003C2AE645